MTDQSQQAVDLFTQGYNCAQAVLAAYAPQIGLTQDQALRLAIGLGGGIARTRETCGAALAMILLVGFKTDPTDKAAAYTLGQKLLDAFKAANHGTCLCRQLLQLPSDAPTPPTPEPRTPQYYRKRPCAEQVRLAAQLIAQYL